MSHCRLCVLRCTHRMYACTDVTQEDGTPLERPEADGWCIPNAAGLHHLLPDGVHMKIRLRRVGGVLVDKCQVRM